MDTTLQSVAIRKAIRSAYAADSTRMRTQASVFEPAEPGTYALRDTEEEVVDPAFISTWSVTEPDA